MSYYISFKKYKIKIKNKKKKREETLLILRLYYVFGILRHLVCEVDICICCFVRIFIIHRDKMFYLGYNFRRGISTFIVEGDKSKIYMKRAEEIHFFSGGEKIGCIEIIFDTE